MKMNYKVILPVALPLALALSVVYTVQGRMEINNRYRTCMQEAQDYQQKGVYQEALNSYQNARKITPSLEVYQAIGQLYMDAGEYDYAQSWYEEEFLDAFPREATTYQYGIQVQLAQDNVPGAFAVYDVYQARKLHSDVIDEQMNSFRYHFRLSGGYSQAGDFSNGLAAVCSNERWKYITPSGAGAFDSTYQEGGTFTELAPVVDTRGDACCIDTQGNVKLTPAYLLEKDSEFGQVVRFGQVREGLVSAYNGEYWNFYDAETYEKRFGGYRDATAITGGVGGVSQDGKKWALISAQGELLTGFDYREILCDKRGAPCRTNAVIVRDENGCWLVDRAGQAVSDAVYEDAHAFIENAPAAVKKDGQWIFVTEDGKEQKLGNEEFEEAKSFSSGMAAAKKDGLWGYIDTSGQWVIPPQFQDAEGFHSSGTAFVMQGGSWLLLRLSRFHH